MTIAVYSYTTVSFFGNIVGVGNRSRYQNSVFFGDKFNRYRCKHYVSTNSALYMGMKINIRIVGRKSSEPWLEEGVDMYEKRLRPSNVEIDTTWHKDNVALMKGIDMDRSKNHKVICLDPTGTQQTSEKFTENVYQWLDQGGSRLSFVIGGAEGLPAELKYPSYSSDKKASNKKNSDAPILISLSVLTFTHQFARLLLIEQIYRATEIKKGSGYHK
jgi:23S rRNA (pseudouridine1915-N3)-methyltransferase